MGTRGDILREYVARACCSGAHSTVTVALSASYSSDEILNVGMYWVSNVFSIDVCISHK